MVPIERRAYSSSSAEGNRPPGLYDFLRGEIAASLTVSLECLNTHLASFVPFMINQMPI